MPLEVGGELLRVQRQFSESGEMVAEVGEDIISKIRAVSVLRPEKSTGDGGVEISCRTVCHVGNHFLLGMVICQSSEKVDHPVSFFVTIVSTDHHEGGGEVGVS